MITGGVASVIHGDPEGTKLWVKEPGLPEDPDTLVQAIREEDTFPVR